MHAFGGFFTEEDRRVLARYVSRQIEAEIASARFVQRATDYDEPRQWEPLGGEEVTP